MKIDLDWIQKELDAGREVELECIDKDGFLADAYFENTEILRRDLIVESVFPYRIDVSNCDYCIVESEYKYFRIKRPTATFDDLFFTLYDLAVEATKEGKLYFRHLSNEQISFATDSSEDGRFNVLNEVS